ncbi:hypothetical protein G4D82_08805 [Flavobacterium sp. CYK-4]|uniref:tail fiber domain-containing protein n=1 Tax=Flavobacterium lotistagni TaxID=2709660 RepID=UPI00140A4C92|nr:tail fiber domain-containing protein [Flavobacterium lotistagni]NHM07317.1 hypothetical protein [Flavobacterium lotistagni]
MKLNCQNCLFGLLLCFSFLSHAQVGINTTNPQAQLDVAASNSSAPSNTDGFLVPRIDNFPATNPTATQQGLLVYLTTTVGLNTPGFYYWDNNSTVWKSMGVASGSNEWKTTGNTGAVSGINFIGTTDNNALDIRTNNLIKVRITEKGQIEVLNTGNSVFIGELAGANDDISGNQNVFVGQQAGQFNSSGEANTFTGALAGRSNTTGNLNTAYGAAALDNNTTGSSNVAIGRSALSANSSGDNNVAVGESALSYKVLGSGNVALGSATMASATNASGNIAIGSEAGYSNLTGNKNIFLGYQAGYNETGSDKLYIDNSSTVSPLIYGDFATDVLKINGTLNVNSAYNLPITAGAANQVLQTDGAGNTGWIDQPTLTETDPQVSVATTNYIPKWDGTTLVDGQIFDNGTNVGVGTSSPTSKVHVVGSIKVDAGKIPFVNTGNSVFIGDNAGFNDDLTNNVNTFVGTNAGRNNTTGSGNVALGLGASQASTLGQQNVALGSNSLKNNLTGNFNTVVGSFAGESATGNSNLFLGYATGQFATGNSNVFIGNSAGRNETGNDKLYIDNTSTVNPLIYGDFVTNLLRVNGTLNVNNAYNLPTTSGTANQVLQTDGAGNATWVNPTSLTITETDPQVSSTTTNYIPKWNGTTLVDGQVFDNGTNVGVGTATPTEKLEVSGKTKTTNLQITTGANTGHVLQSDASGNGTWVNPTSLSITETDPQVSSSTTNYIPKWNGTALVDGQVFDNGTNVGVGTAAPTEKLEVNGKTKTTHLQITTGATNGYVLQSDATGNGAWVNPSALSITETDPQVSATTSNYVPKWNGTTLVDGKLFDNGVNIGIGTTNPNALLTIGDTMTPLPFLPKLSVNTSGNLPLFIGETTGQKGLILGYDGNNIQGRSGANFTVNNDLILNNYGGNVGVGTASPTEKLEVSGKTKTTNLQITTGANAGYVLQSDASGNGTWVNPTTLSITETDPQVSSSTTNYIPKWNGTALVDGQVFDNGTNVGIGTTSPSAKLVLADAFATGGMFKLHDANNTAGDKWWLGFTHGNGAGSVDANDRARIGVEIASGGPGRLYFTTGAAGAQSEAMRITENGNVGIGTTAPSSKLQVLGKTTTSTFQMTSGANANYVLQSDATGNSTWVNPTSLSITETDPQVSSTTSNYIPKWNGTTLVDGQVFDNGTNVGIGTSTPTDKVHVLGNIKVDGGKLPFVNTGGSVFIGLDAGLNDDLVTNDNTYVGGNAGKANVGGIQNVALGSGALELNTNSRNTAVGFNALNSNVNGTNNLALGNYAGATSTGSGNILIGGGAGESTLGSNNILIGTDVGKTNTLSNKLMIDNSGVGNPLIWGDFATDLLRVNGTLNINNAYNLPTTSGTANQVLQTNGAGATSWVNASTLSITESDPQVSSTTTNYIPKWNGTTLVDGQVFDNGTNVGIGTSTPTQAKFVVNGSDTNTFANYGFLNRTTPTGTVNPASAQNYSIYASNRIAASEFNAFSDQRIKNIKGISDSKKDLETLSKIEITNYTLKDSIAKGANHYKKVIAQQVEKVYPQAVSTMTDVVPDIYKSAQMKEGYIALGNNLKAGEKVKIIFASGEEITEVKEATATGFKVDAKTTEKVFVYGRQVNDFHTVDYEALSTLNISATQELLKRIEVLEDENNKLKAEAQNYKALKADVELLKTLLFNDKLKATDTAQAHKY